MPMDNINLWVELVIPTDLDPHGTWYSFNFYDSKEATEPREDGGKIDVGTDGAVIKFHQKHDSPGWWFYNLVIHPLTTQAGRLDMSWLVELSCITLRHPRSRGSAARNYSYTLAIHWDGHPENKLFVDPQLVDVSGGPGF